MARQGSRSFPRSTAASRCFASLPTGSSGIRGIGEAFRILTLPLRFTAGMPVCDATAWIITTADGIGPNTKFIDDGNDTPLGNPTGW